MVSPPATRVGLVFESLEASSQVAQLEAEIASARDALARRQQIGVATQRFAITPSGPGHYWRVSPKNGHVRVRDIALAMINAHCSRLSQAEVEILSGED